MAEKIETMKKTIKNLSPSKRELEIEVAAEEATAEYEKVLKQYASWVKMDGFRRGKAPLSLVRRLFHAEIREAVIDSLAPRALGDSLRTENIRPVGTPVISELSWKEGGPFRFKAKLDVLPEFELPPYKNISVKKREIKIEKEEINRSLEELRQKSAEYLPVEGRGVAEGDYVVLEMKGKDLKTKRLLPTERILVLAGHAENQKVLNERLLSLKTGETNRLVISYPSDHREKKLAGREIEYEIKVLSIKEKKIPEMTDEWAKDLGEFASLSDLKERVRKELEAAKERTLRREMADEIIQNISGQLNMEMPETLMEEEAQFILRQWAQQTAPGTLSPDKIEESRQKARDQAERNIRNSLVLGKIADQEGLAVTDEDIESEIRAMAQNGNMPYAQLAETINKEGKREELRNNLRIRKAVDFLLENVIIN